MASLEGQCAMSADETKGKFAKMSQGGILCLTVMLLNCLLDICFYLQTRAAFNLVQKRLFLQWAAVNREWHGYHTHDVTAAEVTGTGLSQPDSQHVLGKNLYSSASH